MNIFIYGLIILATVLIVVIPVEIITQNHYIECRRTKTFDPVVAAGLFLISFIIILSAIYLVLLSIR